MFNLLIVDDEPLITDSLYDLFAARAEGELNVLRAYSGREALGRMQQMRVDILLTDISMPDINGLEVHRRVAALWPECAVIYLTSFNDFEYVQQAIRNNSIDYIMKTEGDEVVVRAVDKAIEHLQNAQNNRQAVEQAQSRLSMALPLLREMFLGDLVEEPIDALGEDLDAQLRELNIPLRGSHPVMLVVGQAQGYPKLPSSQRRQLLWQVRERMENFYSAIAAAACATHDKSHFLLLLQPNGGGEPEETRWRNLALRVSGTLDTLQAACQQTGLGAMSLAGSAAVVPWNSVGSLYDSLRSRLGGTGDSGILYFDHTADSDGGNPPPDSDLEQRSLLLRLGLLRARLDEGSLDGFLADFDAAMAGIEAFDPAEGTTRAQAYYRVAVLLMEHINQHVEPAMILRAQHLDRLADYESYASWETARDALRSMGQMLLRQTAAQEASSDHHVYAYIRDYTACHIGEDLSLTHFAQLLNFHPFYLSKLFKRISGHTLTEYVSSIKIARAREMLARNNCTIGEVSSALGFVTSSYFTSFFRKHTGQSPNEYRHLVQRP